MQINRLFEIVYILLEKKRSTAGELAAHFEVSKRTILRDLDVLCAAGIPIYTTKGKGGGIAILNNFVLNKTTVSEEEQNQILFALQSLSATRHTDTDDIASRLGALFDKTDTTWIEVDFSRWGKTVPDKQKFELLKTAVIKKQPLSFLYASSYGETTDRTVCPLKLVFKSNAWYLHAYCQQKEDYRLFRINRMLQLAISPGCFAGMDFAAPPIEENHAVPASLIQLKLQFIPEVAFRVYDEFDEHNVIKNKDGSFTVAIDMPEDYWLYGFLLSFGTAVKVLEPHSVAVSLQTQAEKIKNLYI